MLDIKQIESFFPENLRPYQRNLLREYLQYKILEAIYDSPLGQKLVFMGGTAIHIIHGNARFSEDLDFDNRGLDKSDFQALISTVTTSLKRNGYRIESRIVTRTAFRSYLKFPDILYGFNISSHRNEKLNIQIDTESQMFSYEPDKFILNKFDVFQRISVVPADILLAQKLACIFLRPRLMGRDFFDVVFLLGKTEPNMDYLREKVGIKDVADLRERLITICENIESDKLARDLEPFLYDPAGAKRLHQFVEFIISRLSGS